MKIPTAKASTKLSSENKEILEKALREKIVQLIEAATAKGETTVSCSISSRKIKDELKALGYVLANPMMGFLNGDYTEIFWGELPERLKEKL